MSYKNYRTFEEYKNSSSYNGEPAPENTSNCDDNNSSKPTQNKTFNDNIIDKIAAQREKRNLRDKERRANMSEEQRASMKAKSAEYERKKWAEMKASSDPTMYEERLEKQREYHQNKIVMRHEKQKEYRTQNAEYRRNKLLEMKSSDPEAYERHLANRREYQRKRYAAMKNADIQIRNRTVDGNEDEEDVNIEELQNLANKRRKLIDTSIQYKRNNKRSKWVDIPQVWDEEHPCP